MKLEHGWITSARKVPSPHFNARPDNEAPSLLIIHNISLPPGNLAVRGSTSCSPVRYRLMRIPILRISPSYAWRRTV